MKVTCLYCDSYVENDETAVCPLCGAPLGEAVKAAQEQKKAEQAEADANAAETAKMQAEEQTKQTLITAAAGLLGSATGSLFHRNSMNNRPLPSPGGERGPQRPNGRGAGNPHGPNGRGRL